MIHNENSDSVGGTKLDISLVTTKVVVNGIPVEVRVNPNNSTTGTQVRMATA